jgi:hypothetical protein
MVDTGMAKTRVARLKNRVMLSFNDRDLDSLAQEAQEARLPVSTYARLLILNRPKAGAAPLPSTTKAASRASTSR